MKADAPPPAPGEERGEGWIGGAAAAGRPVGSGGGGGGGGKKAVGKADLRPKGGRPNGGGGPPGGLKKGLKQRHVYIGHKTKGLFTHIKPRFHTKHKKA